MVASRLIKREKGSLPVDVRRSKTSLLKLPYNRSRLPKVPICDIERFSYDLEMKTREQNRNNKRTEIEQFDWFIERIQTRLAFGWLSERSRKKTSCPRTF